MGGLAESVAQGLGLKVPATSSRSRSNLSVPADVDPKKGPKPKTR
jgi:hypothetical protein